MLLPREETDSARAAVSSAVAAAGSEAVVAGRAACGLFLGANETENPKIF